MSTQNDNKNLVLKYFNLSEIKDIKELGNRIIVTINAKEDGVKQDKLKQELGQANPNKSYYVKFYNGLCK